MLNLPRILNDMRLQSLTFFLAALKFMRPKNMILFSGMEDNWYNRRFIDRVTVTVAIIVTAVVTVVMTVIVTL